MLTWRKETGLALRLLLTGALISFMRATPSRPKFPPRRPAAKYHYSGVRLQHMNLGGTQHSVHNGPPKIRAVFNPVQLRHPSRRQSTPSPVCWSSVRLGYHLLLYLRQHTEGFFSLGILSSILLHFTVLPSFLFFYSFSFLSFSPHSLPPSLPSLSPSLSLISASSHKLYIVKDGLHLPTNFSERKPGPAVTTLRAFSSLIKVQPLPHSPTLLPFLS